MRRMKPAEYDEYFDAVAVLAWEARCLDYFARVSERFGKPEWFYEGG